MAARDPRRRYSSTDRSLIYAAAGGLCQGCGRELGEGWHADHREPHSFGGATVLGNAQALCETCNLKKGTMSDIWVRKPREWQAAAFADYTSRLPTNYLAAVCPGGGKTEFALAVAKYLFQQGRINFAVVVSPTDALTRQWADKAAPFGIPLNPEVRANAPLAQPREFHGISITYHLLAQRGAAASFCAALQLRKVLVILDEVHHAGETKAWGEAVEAAFDIVHHRLLLSGTPKRSDTAKIPFATYAESEPGVARIVRDYDYGTGRGVRDQVIRRLDFRFYDSQVHELPFGELVPTSSNLSDAVTRDDHSKLMGVVMDPESGWFADLLPAVHKELTAIRRTVPDAGCLILANNKEHVRAYAKLIKKVTGCDATTVTSDDPAARASLEKFGDSQDPYLIAIRMVSEGVDIPRLRVLVWLTRTKTELFFAQGTARIVRIPHQRDSSPAVAFMPALSVLRELAQGVEDDIAHEIRLLEEQVGAEEIDDYCPDAAPGRNGAPGADPAPSDGQPPARGKAPGHSQMLFSSFSVDNVELESTFLGSEVHDVDIHHAAQQIVDEDGLSQTEIALVRTLIARGRIPRPGAQPPDASLTVLAQPSEQQVAIFRIREDCKRQLQTLVAALGRKHYQDDFIYVRNQINMETGARSEHATVGQLKAGIAYAENWLRTADAGGRT